MITGACLCGGVTWRLDGAIELINYCHCSMCRRIHGTPFGAFAHARARDFRWLRGAPSIAQYESSTGVFRCFCSRCGSSVPVIEADEVCIPAGGIDGDPGIRPSVHIFVASKAPWHEITDLLPRHAGFPPADAW